MDSLMTSLRVLIVWFVVSAVGMPVLRAAPPAPAPAEQQDPQPDAQQAAQARQREVQREADERRRAEFRRRFQVQIGGRIQIGGLRTAVPGGEDDLTATTFRPDRESLRLLRKAVELRDQERYADTVQALGRILEADEDSFFPTSEDGHIHRSVKAEAQRMIGELPAAGRDSYQLQYGAAAAQMLAEAVRDGDPVKLGEVSRRFFHTDAGYQATHLLGIHQFDQGRPLAAALCFDRLSQTGAPARRYEPMLSIRLAACWTRAGMPEAAQETLTSVKRRYPRASITVAGRKLPLFSRDEAALGWLATAVGPQQHFDPPGVQQWTMHRGSASRNARSPGGRPLLAHRWRIPTVNSGPLVEQVVSRLHGAYVEQQVGALPGFHPLAVKDVVLMRTSTNLLAADFKTGKRIWEVPVDDAVAQILAGAAPTVKQMSEQLVSELDRRMWEDATYGTLSSDGEYVFSVEDLNLQLEESRKRVRVMINGRPVLMPNDNQRFNRLAAHDVRTGKLKWEIGGPNGDYELDQAGSFFLGPPLPLVGHLYVLAEVKGEIRLLVLDAKTAEVKWTQQLAVLERSIGEDPFRRYAGVSPSYADGVLVCPTAAGTVVAVDLTTRSLLWGCRYPRQSESAAVHGRVVFMQLNMMGQARGTGNARWADSSVTLAEGRVLLTPVDSDYIECLNLVDGETLWQKPREDGMYIACVDQGKALLVGQSGVRALNLADGTPAWQGDVREYPGASVPSGRGFFDGRLYFLPLASASVAAIDVASGKVVSVSSSAVNGASDSPASVPGNLICYNGSVISQNVNYVECYDQLEALRRRVDERLAQSPDDADALARLGEIDLQEGRLADAVTHLRRSFHLQDDPRTRELLFDGILKLLKSDFAAQRELLTEIEQVTVEPWQRSAYLRLTATGLESAGELPAAFDAYLRLLEVVDVAQEDDEDHELERLDGTWSVRRGRWVQTRLAGLREAADDDERQAIDRQLEKYFREAVEAESDEPLRQFVSHFAAHPAVDEARLALALRRRDAGSPLEAELLLRQVIASGEASRAATAAAQLAAMYAAAERAYAALPLVETLAERWADVIGDNGKTGAQMATELAEAGVRPEPPLSESWPIGLVENATQPGSRMTAARRILVDALGHRGSFDEELSVDFDSQRRTLVARDVYGNERWRYSLINEGQTGRSSGASFFHVRSLGHLYLVSLGQRIMALDTLSSRDPANATVLWTRDLTETIPGLPANRGFNAQVTKSPWAVSRYVPGDSFGRQIGITGPVTPGLITFLHNRSLVAVSPTTGDTLWTRGEIQPGSDVFGDEHMLFVAGPQDRQATVLRGSDGLDLGKRSVPPADERMIDFGSRIVRWEVRAAGARLSMTDAWEATEIWSHDFDAGSQVWLVDSEGVGVMQADGRFRLITLPDGKTLVDEQLKAEPALSEIFVLKSRDSYTLVANRPRVNRREVQVHPVPSGYGNPLINGRLYCFDRGTGAPIWDEPVEVQDQALLLRQPSELPVYVFVCQQYEYRDDRRRGSGHGKILCIDKRTGRKVYDGELPAAINNFEVSSNPRQQTVLVSTPVSSVELRFTGQAIPEPPPFQDDDEGEDEDGGTPAGKAVLRGLRTLTESITGSARGAKDEERQPPDEPAGVEVPENEQPNPFDPFGDPFDDPPDERF